MHFYKQVFIEKSHWFGLWTFVGLCCTINTGPSLGLFSGIPLPPCVLEIMQDQQPCPFVLAGYRCSDVSVGQHISLVLALGTFRVGQISCVFISNVISPESPWIALFGSDEQGSGTVLLLSYSQGWFSHTYNFRANSSVLPRQGVGALS